jgi:hypothetical protein
MALNPRDRNTLTTHLGTATNLAYIVGSLSAGRGKLMPVKYANFEEIKWWLKSMLLITTDDAGVREAADLIQQLSTARPALVIETAPPPPLDVAKEKKKITDDCAHAATIRTVYVQLDVDQNKHQPSSVPIGTREASGESFGTYATKAWHESHTMDYMATWAATLTGMVEGKKVEHGQSRRIDIDGAGPCCFEGLCVLLGGTRYVSFHCYPNSRS